MLYKILLGDNWSIAFINTMNKIMHNHIQTYCELCIFNVLLSTCLPKLTCNLFLYIVCTHKFLIWYNNLCKCLSFSYNIFMLYTRYTQYTIPYVHKSLFVCICKHILFSESYITVFIGNHNWSNGVAPHHVVFTKFWIVCYHAIPEFFICFFSFTTT